MGAAPCLSPHWPSPERLPQGFPGELAVLREASQRWLARERHRPRVPSGVEAVDRLLGGGWPAGKVGELVGVGSGKTTVAVRTLAETTGRGELGLWVDACGELDPASLAAWGVWLECLLVVRVQEVLQAVRAVELVLAGGGFTTVVVDLGERGGAGERKLPLRLARAVERAGVVGLVLTEKPWMGAWAGVRVVFAPPRPVFGELPGVPPWFAGWELQPVLGERAAASPGG
jgi:hypothetical protein